MDLRQTAALSDSFHKMTFLKELERVAWVVERRLDELLGQGRAPIGGATELAQAMRYAVLGGGKRIRPFLLMESARLFGVSEGEALDAACALECVHCYSLVHDDLPAMDDDAVRRGRPTLHIAFGEGVALLAGDALLAEALRLALTYESNGVARELVGATLGMIGGQYLDVTGDDDDLARLHRLKTGRLFLAAVLMGLEVAGVAEDERTVWLALGDDVGLLFQVVDDLLDGDGYAARLGAEDARQLAQEVASRARARLDELAVDTTV